MHVSQEARRAEEAGDRGGAGGGRVLESSTLGALKRLNTRSTGRLLKRGYF